MYNYYVTQTTDACESDAATASLTIYPLPVIDLGNDTTLYPNQEYTFGPFPEEYSYFWNDGSENAYFLFSADAYETGEH